MILRLGAPLAATVGLIGAVAWAQAPGSARPPGPRPSSERRPPGAIPAASSPSAAAEPSAGDNPAELTEEQRKKRLERVLLRADERRKNREQRRQDLRRAVKRRLGRVLEDAPLPAAVRVELQQHARRVAKLRRIRVIAAQADDIETVIRVDRVLARETLRHERWWTHTLPTLVGGSQEPGP